MKKDLEMDFSNISLESKKDVSGALTGIKLSIPAGKRSFLAKDLAECSNQEFLDWVVSVYPMLDTSKTKLELFSKIPDRIRLYDDVINFYKRADLFIVNKTNKKISSN